MRELRTPGSVRGVSSDGYLYRDNRPISDSKTNVQINSQYTLTITRKVGDKFESVGVWNFTSREPDTQTVDVAYKPTNVTCQSSNKLEKDFLTEVTARLPSISSPAPVAEPPAPT